jgi:hypothetical protein
MFRRGHAEPARHGAVRHSPIVVIARLSAIGCQLSLVELKSFVLSFVESCHESQSS